MIRKEPTLSRNQRAANGGRPAELDISATLITAIKSNRLVCSCLLIDGHDELVGAHHVETLARGGLDGARVML
jgi:hypothetical protein